MGKSKDLTGQKSGKLTAIKRVGKNSQGYWLWHCQCECGNTTVVSVCNFGSGRTQSCGCARIKHGQTKTRMYRIWAAMKARCSDPNNKCHELYLDKGISVCEEWQTFEPFYNWSIANGYDDSLTIDRKDSNGNYCPENCRWATQQEQANNVSKNHLITYNEETKTISQWARELGLNYSTLHTRITRSTMTIEEAMSKK